MRKFIRIIILFLMLCAVGLGHGGIYGGHGGIYGGGVSATSISSAIVSSPDYAFGNGFRIAASDAYTWEKNIADYICTGTNDEVEIQAAVDRLTQGGMILLSSGTFVVSDTIALDSDCTLAGLGQATLLKIPNARNVLLKDVVKATGKDRVTVRDLQIDGNRANQTATENSGNGVHFYQSSGLIENVYVHSMGVTDDNSSGIYITGVASTISGVRVSKCVVWDNLQHGICTTSGANYVTIVDCLARNNLNEGIHTSTGEYVTIANCISVSNAVSGINLQNALYATCTNCVIRNNGVSGIYASIGRKTITGCYIQASGGYGINIDSTSGSSYYITISGNTVVGNTYGVRLSQVLDCVVSSNTISTKDTTHDAVRVENLCASGDSGNLCFVGNFLECGGGASKAINVATAGYINIVADPNSNCLIGDIYIAE